MTALLKHVSDSAGVKSFSILPFIKGAQLIVKQNDFGRLGKSSMHI